MFSRFDREKCLKIIVVGHSGTGKTCLCNRFVKLTFPETYTHTLGPNIISANCMNDNQNCKLFLWDIGGGGEKFHTMRPAYYHHADAFVFLFDVSDSRERFVDIYSYWWPELIKECPDAPIILVGSKIDLRFSKPDAITTAEGEEMASQIGAVKYSEISSLRDMGVTELFKEVTSYGNHYSITVKKNVIHEQEKRSCTLL